MKEVLKTRWKKYWRPDEGSTEARWKKYWRQDEGSAKDKIMEVLDIR